MFFITQQELQLNIVALNKACTDMGRLLKNWHTYSEKADTVIYHGGELTIRVLKANSRDQVYSDEKFQNKVLDLINDFADSGGKLLTLDVFDTVLLRNQKSEIRRFYEMSELFSKASYGMRRGIDAWGFLHARLEASRLSYSFSQPVEGCREGSLEEIHQTMAKILDLPYNFTAEMLNIELDYEKNNTLTNPLIPTILECARESSLTVVLLSDMYMRRSHISDLLADKYPDCFEESRIYSSADLKISKQSGLLYDRIAETKGIKPEEAMHIGDNLIVDYHRARERGWRALYLPHTEYEARSIADDEKKFMQQAIASGVDLRLCLVS